MSIDFAGMMPAVASFLVMAFFIWLFVAGFKHTNRNGGSNGGSSKNNSNNSNNSNNGNS